MLGTHEAIVTDVVRELLARDADAASAEAALPVTEGLHVDAGALASLVRTSRDYLAMQAVLDEGKSFEQATREIDILTSIIDTFQYAGLGVEYLAGGDVRLGLELAFRGPFLLDAPAADKDTERR